MLVPPLIGSKLDGGDFVLAEWVDDGMSSEQLPIAPLHRHLADDEAWYVLDGSLGFVRGDERLEAAAGAAVLVPRGVAHTFWNAGDTAARYLIVMTPRIAGLIEAIHQPRAPGGLAELFRQYESELLG